MTLSMTITDSVIWTDSLMTLVGTITDSVIQTEVSDSIFMKCVSSFSFLRYN